MTSTDVQAWASPKAFAYALVGGGIALIAAAFATGTEPAGLVLIVVAALLLIGVGASAALVRPRLSLVNLDGTVTVTVRTIFGATTYAAADVERVRVLMFRRIGRSVGHLELEFNPEPGNRASVDDEHEELSDTRIVVFSRWDLGADIHEVADALASAGFDVER